MGRLAIIEDDSATSVAAAAATSTKTSSDKSETKTKTSVAEASSSSVDTLGTKGGTNGGTNKTGTTEVKRCCNKKLQGGISDESGYYEEDELQDDDSIEIVYDKCLAKNGDRIQHQNTANTAAGMKNTQQQHVSSSTSGAVSITPIPVSGFSSVHQPASSSNLAQGRQKINGNINSISNIQYNRAQIN